MINVLNKHIRTGDSNYSLMIDKQGSSLHVHWLDLTLHIISVLTVSKFEKMASTKQPSNLNDIHQESQRFMHKPS